MPGPVVSHLRALIASACALVLLVAAGVGVPANEDTPIDRDAALHLEGPELYVEEGVNTQVAAVAEPVPGVVHVLLDPGVLLVADDEGIRETSLQAEGFERALVASPDGTTWMADGVTLREVSPDGEVLRTVDPPSDIGVLASHPDGDLAAITDVEEPGAQLWTLDPDAPEDATAVDVPGAWTVAVDDAGRTFSGYGPPNVADVGLRVVDDGEVVRDEPMPDLGYGETPAFLADGSVVVRDGEGIAVLDPDGLEVQDAVDLADELDVLVGVGVAGDDTIVGLGSLEDPDDGDPGDRQLPGEGEHEFSALVQIRDGELIERDVLYGFRGVIATGADGSVHATTSGYDHQARDTAELTSVVEVELVLTLDEEADADAAGTATSRPPAPTVLASGVAPAATLAQDEPDLEDARDVPVVASVFRSDGAVPEGSVTFSTEQQQAEVALDEDGQARWSAPADADVVEVGADFAPEGRPALSTSVDAPAPDPAPDPDPEPTPEPDPDPEPESEAEADPDPPPELEGSPEGGQEAAPVPEPTPEPEPDSDPDTDPAPGDEPTEVPAEEPGDEPTDEPGEAATEAPEDEAPEASTGEDPDGSDDEAASQPPEAAEEVPGQPDEEAAGPTDPAEGSAPEARDLSTLAASVSSPGDGPLRGGRLAANAALAAGAALLLLFPAELFNATLRRNYDRIMGWLAPWRRRLRAVQRVEAAGGPARSLLVVAFAAVCAMLGGFLDPDFGLDAASFRLVAGHLVSILVLSVVGAYTYLRASRRLGADGTVRLRIAAVLVCLLSVVLSRFVGFEPGYFFGLAIGVQLHGLLPQRQRARVTSVWAGSMLAVALAAWTALGPLRSAALASADGLVPHVAAEATASLIVATLTALVVLLLPLTFLEGRDLYLADRRLWAGVYTVTLLVFLAVIANPVFTPTTDAEPIVWVSLFVAFGLASVLFWGGFRLLDARDRRREEATASGGERR